LGSLSTPVAGVRGWGEGFKAVESVFLGSFYPLSNLEDSSMHYGTRCASARGVSEGFVSPEWGVSAAPSIALGESGSRSL